MQGSKGMTVGASPGAAVSVGLGEGFLAAALRIEALLGEAAADPLPEVADTDVQGLIREVGGADGLGVGCTATLTSVLT